MSGRSWRIAPWRANQSRFDPHYFNLRWTRQRAKNSFSFSLAVIFPLSANYFFLLSFLFLLSEMDPPGGMSQQENSFTLYGLEPVWCGRWDLNPRTPTGQAPQACASKTLPFSTGLFDLAWQHEPPIIGRTPANTRPAPARTPVKDKALIGFRHPIQFIESG